MKKEVQENMRDTKVMRATGMKSTRSIENMMAHTMRTVVMSLVCSVLLSNVVSAAPDVSTSEGRAFMFGVLPSRQLAEDSITINFRSKSLATITVRVTTIRGEVLERVARVLDSRRAVSISFARKDIELRGAGGDTSITAGSQLGSVIRSQVVRITADSAVTAVVIGGGSLSSYAMDLLPENMWGRNYIVPTVPACVVAADSAKGGIDTVLSGRSQFVMIARENDTRVTVLLNVSTPGMQPGARTIVLQAGEAYMVQSELDTIWANTDLSATQVTSNKPIAVFAGNSNASLPLVTGLVSSSKQRGSLAQQVLPADRLKKKYVVVPLSLTDAGVQTNREWVRIYATTNKTMISLSGESPVEVNPEKFLEREITQPLFVDASEPVMVCQLVSSSNINNDSAGNAALFTAMSVSQWSQNIASNAIQIRQSGVKRYLLQYLLVMADTAAFKNLTIDGQTYAFAPIVLPGSPYGYVIRRVADGIHSVESSLPCGVIMGGVGSLHRIASVGDVSFPLQPYLIPALRVPDVSARTGDTATVLVVLDSLQFPPQIMNTSPRTFEFDLCVNASVLTPQSAEQRGDLKFGEQCLRLRYQMTELKFPVTIASIPMICGLGNTAVSNIEVQNGVWLSVFGDTIPWLDNGIVGKMTINNVWSDTMGLRLLNPQSGTLAIAASPNPVQSTCSIECSTSDPSLVDARLTVYNSVGETFFDEREELVGFKGKKVIQIDMSSWPVGVYSVRFDRGTESIATRVMVSR